MTMRRACTSCVRSAWAETSPPRHSDASEDEPYRLMLTQLSCAAQVCWMDQRRLGIAAHRAPVVHQDDRSAPGGHLYRPQRVAFGHDLTTGQRRAVELDAHAVTGCNRERAVLQGGREIGRAAGRERGGVRAVVRGAREERDG